MLYGAFGNATTPYRRKTGRLTGLPRILRCILFKERVSNRARINLGDVQKQRERCSSADASTLEGRSGPEKR